MTLVFSQIWIWDICVQIKSLFFEMILIEIINMFVKILANLLIKIKVTNGLKILI